MTTILVDECNDLQTTNGSLSLISELEGAIQSCEQAAKTQFAEVFLNTVRGIPNFETIWASRANVAQYEAFLRRIILTVPDVTGIASLNIEVQDNLLTYTIEIETIHGEGIVTNAV